MNKLYILAIIILLYNSARAQEAQISMFTTSPMLLNPAAMGYFQTDGWRIWLNHRDQWSSFLNRGVVTSNVSFDMPTAQKKVAAGLSISNNMASKGALNDLSCMGAFGYTVKFGQKQISYISFGLHAGIKQRSYNPSKIAFGSQFIDGQGFDLNLPNGEINTATSKLLPDFNAGALWYMNDKWRMWRPWAGIGVYHVLNPNQSFTSTKDVLPRKFIVYAGSEFTVSQMLLLKPQMIFSNQANLTQTSIGVSAQITNYKNKNSAKFELGSYYRNRESIVLMLGFEFAQYACFIDYEITSSSLNTINNGNGAFELTLRYIHNNGRSKTKF